MELLEIVKDLVIPASKRGSGAKGSKFFDATLSATLAALLLNQGVVLPFMDLGEVKDPAKRQRYATDYRVKQWAKDSGRHYTVFIIDPVAEVGKEGEEGYKAGTPGGIGIKLVKIDEVKPAVAPAAEKPAEGAE